jgi:hypothetical protein
MATLRVSDGHEKFHALSSRGAPADLDNTVEPPAHPIFSLQGAFEESIVESTQENPLEALDFGFDLDAKMRRWQLLEAEHFEDGWMTKWKNVKSSKHHPFLKLMSQIVFGMHLLEQDQAKSTVEVVKILQTHVNEVDSFLERTHEDFNLAVKDIEERIRYLKLPMVHTDVFDLMLDDKKYRTELLAGNEKIERIVERTTKAMQCAMMDIDSGIQSTAELRSYMDGVRMRLSIGNRAVGEVLSAMRGNEQGWTKYLRDLRIQGKHLGDTLLTLSSITSEIARRAGVASRRNKPQSRTVSPTKRVVSPSVRSKFTKETTPQRKAGAWVNKPLPREPINCAGTPESDSSRNPSPDSIPMQLERPPSQPLPIPHARKSSKSSTTSGKLQPRPAGSVNGTADRDNTAALAVFLGTSGPLRSNPPQCVAKEIIVERPATHRARAQSDAERQKMTPYKRVRPNPHFRRSVSQPILPTCVSKPTIRKPLAPPKDQKGQKDLTFVHIEELTSPTIGYVLTIWESLMDLTNIYRFGFTRRLSKRVKHLPQPIKSAVRPDTAPAPIDSARFIKPSPPAEYDPFKYNTNEIKTPPTPASAAVQRNIARKESNLALFPKYTAPPPPAQLIVRGIPKEFVSFMTPTPSLESEKHAKGRSRTLSLTKFFHRKQWSLSSS